MGLRKLRRSLNYPVFNRSKRSVTLLFDDPVTRTSNSGIYADYQQVLKLLSRFQERYGFFCHVQV